MNGLMIVGTDTGVGKTMLCELLLADARERGVHVGIYKPVCTGSERDATGHERWSDIERLQAATGGRWATDDVCPQRFRLPAAPPVAATAEGRCVDEGKLNDGLERWRDLAEILIVEGVGGLLCPITERRTISDLAFEWKMPIVVVSANRLGTINHTLLTLELAQRRGLQVAGWVLNHVEQGDSAATATNAEEIRKRTSIPFLGEIVFASTSELQTGQTSSRMFIERSARSLCDILSLARAV